MFKQKTMVLVVFVMSVALVGSLTGCFKPQTPLQKPLDLSNQTGLSQENVTIFFSKSRGSQVVTEGVVRQVPLNEKAEPLKFALVELLKGPNDEESTRGFYSEIPKGTRLIGFTQRDNTLQVNLSQQFASGGGSNSMQARLAELSKTVRSNEKEKPVYINIEGQQLQVLGGEGVMVNEPINKGSQDVQ